VPIAVSRPPYDSLVVSQDSMQFRKTIDNLAAKCSYLKGVLEPQRIVSIITEKVRSQAWADLEPLKRDLLPLIDHIAIEIMGQSPNSENLRQAEWFASKLFAYLDQDLATDDLSLWGSQVKKILDAQPSRSSSEKTNDLAIIYLGLSKWEKHKADIAITLNRSITDEAKVFLDSAIAFGKQSLNASEIAGTKEDQVCATHNLIQILLQEPQGKVKELVSLLSKSGALLEVGGTLPVLPPFDEERFIVIECHLIRALVYYGIPQTQEVSQQIFGYFIERLNALDTLWSYESLQLVLNAMPKIVNRDVQIQAGELCVKIAERLYPEGAPRFILLQSLVRYGRLLKGELGLDILKRADAIYKQLITSTAAETSTKPLVHLFGAIAQAYLSDCYSEAGNREIREILSHKEECMRILDENIPESPVARDLKNRVWWEYKMTQYGCLGLVAALVFSMGLFAINRGGSDRNKNE